MPFERTVNLAGNDYIVTTGVWGSSKLNLALDSLEISSLDNEQLILVLRTFQEIADELEVIGYANEFHWNTQYLTPNKLLIILKSKFSSNEDKRKASILLENPLYDFSKTTSGNVRKLKPGFIYLLKSLHNPSNYKIGLSKNPQDRVKQIGNSELLHSFQTDDMIYAESILHRKFVDKQIFGEWFNLSEGDIKYITSISEFKNGKFKGAFTQ